MTYSHPSDLSKPLISSNHTWKPIFLLEVLLTHTVPLPPSNHPRLRFRLMCSIVYCMVHKRIYGTNGQHRAGVIQASQTNSLLTTSLANCWYKTLAHRWHVRCEKKKPQNERLWHTTATLGYSGRMAAKSYKLLFTRKHSQINLQSTHSNAIKPSHKKPSFMSLTFELKQIW